MRQRTVALVALGMASVLVLGVVGNGDASLATAYGSLPVPGPRPLPLPSRQPTVVAAQAPRSTPSPAPGAAPHPRETGEAWARSSLNVAGV
jgi:hypothetical protein